MQRVLLSLPLLAGAAAPAGAQTIADLFRPVDAADAPLIQDILTDWASRPIDAIDWRFEGAEVPIGAGRYRIYSHEIGTDGSTGASLRHYGAMRLPDAYLPTDPPDAHPVLVFCHGGVTGIDLVDTEAWVQNWPDGSAARTFLLVPAYRAEPLRVGLPSTAPCTDPLVWCSDGDGIPFDRDVDDVLVFLSGALAQFGQADAARVAVYGESRGGTVALLAAARDARLRRLVDLFGPSDLLLPYLERNAQLYLDAQCNVPVNCQDCLIGAAQQPAVPAHSQVVDHVLCVTKIHEIVRDFAFGSLSLDDARKALLRRSPVLFAADLPNLEFHHAVGEATCAFDDAGCCDYFDQPACQDHGDWRVSRDHGYALQATLVGLGAAAPPQRFFPYPSGEFQGSGHNPNLLHGNGSGGSAFARIEDFLLRSRCERSPNSAGEGALIGHAGSLSLAANDFQLTVLNCPPNVLGIFFFGAGEAHLPLGQGFRCVGLPICRTPPIAVQADGVGTRPLDFTTLSGICDPAAPANAGVQWYFQFWHRDSDPGPTTNLSDFMRVEFLP